LQSIYITERSLFNNILRNSSTMEEGDIRDAYLDPKNGFTGVHSFSQHVSADKRFLRESIQSLPEYSRFYPRRVRFPRVPTVILHVDDVWQADLLILSSHSNINDGYTAILTCIDCASKFAFVKPLKTKTGSEVASKFKEIFEESGRFPKRLFTDAGILFYCYQATNG